MGQPRAVRKARSGPVRQDGEEDGADAALEQVYVDRSSVCKAGC